MEIDYTGLEMAFQRSIMDEATYWLDKETGQVLVLDEWSREQLRKAKGPDELTDPVLRDLWPLWCLVGWEHEWWDEEEESEPWPEPPPGVTTDRYVQVPRIESYEAYNDMVEFAATVEDGHLSELLELALDGQGAFRRFKDVLARYPEERERWFEFSHRRLRERVEEWLESVGVRLGGGQEQ